MILCLQYEEVLLFVVKSNAFRGNESISKALDNSKYSHSKVNKT